MTDHRPATSAMIVNLSPTVLLNQTDNVRVAGSPTRLEMEEGVEFDGVNDGIVLAKLGSVAGLTRFRMVARIRPSRSGAFEQRFFHIQADGSDDRLLMEIRLLPSGEWYADTYFEYRAKSVLLQDPSRLHQCDAWATYELVYDGRTLWHSIDGVDELSTSMPGARLPERGMISLGVRATMQHPFAGAIGCVEVWSE